MLVFFNFVFSETNLSKGLKSFAIGAINRVFLIHVSIKIELIFYSLRVL